MSDYRSVYSVAELKAAGVIQRNRLYLNKLTNPAKHWVRCNRTRALNFHYWGGRLIGYRVAGANKRIARAFSLLSAAAERSRF